MSIAGHCSRCGCSSNFLVQTPQAAAEAEQAPPAQEPLNVAPKAQPWLRPIDLVVGLDEQSGLPVLVVDTDGGFAAGLVAPARYVLTREAALEVGARLLAASVDPQELRQQFTEALVQKALKESP
jgi:hypothetical protein